MQHTDADDPPSSLPDLKVGRDQAKAEQDGGDDTNRNDGFIDPASIGSLVRHEPKGTISASGVELTRRARVKPASTAPKIKPVTTAVNVAVHVLHRL